MITCENCKHFEKDSARSQKLGEPLGRCKNQTCGYVIGCFDVERCDGFDERKVIEYGNRL